MNETREPSDRLPSAPPASSGPASVVARLVITAPPSAAAGSRIRVRCRVEVRSDAPRIITGAAGSWLLITQGGRVVGGVGPDADEQVPLPLRAGTSRPAQVLPETVRLVGAAESSESSEGPELPPGDYAIVGVLAYGGDPLGTGTGGTVARPFTLVSSPVPISVR